jgi:hypothetical protein
VTRVVCVGLNPRRLTGFAELERVSAKIASDTQNLHPHPDNEIERTKSTSHPPLDSNHFLRRARTTQGEHGLALDMQIWAEY